MVTVNKTLNEDIKEFPIFKIVGNRLVPAPEITCINDYIHGAYDLHHYIKAQSYKHNREWYEQNGIKQKLILMPREVHVHLENPVYNLTDEKFFKRYHIPKDMLLFNKKKWIEKEVLIGHKDNGN